jgi:hypothetical protein
VDVDAEGTVDVLLAQSERYKDVPQYVPGLHSFRHEMATA